MSSLWSKYLALPPRTRILIGGGLVSYALIAQTLSDKAEEPLGLKATEEEKEKLWRYMPKIRTVERDAAGRVSGKEGG